MRRNGHRRCESPKSITFAGIGASPATLALESAAQVVGGTFGNTLASFGLGDTLDLKGFTYAAGATAILSGGTLTVTSNGKTDWTLANGKFSAGHTVTTNAAGFAVKG